MALSNLNTQRLTASDNKDALVVIKCLAEIAGGRTLATEELAAGVDFIRAGHIIIRDTEGGEFKPLGVTEGAYKALPEKHEFVGVLKSTVNVRDARAAIVTIGQVCEGACPYPVTDEIKKGLTHIQFINY